MNLKKQIEEKVIKSFGLSDLALKNRITIVFLSLMLTILGLISYDRLPKESFPEVDQSNVIVGVSYPGNSPIDIENLITRPIEKEINIISEVKEIRSTSMQGFSTIISEFESGIEIEYAKSKIKDAVDKAKAELPNDLPFEPNIYEISFSDFPIMHITLSGKYSIERLEDYAEILQDEIEKISEISKVKIFGVEEKEVAIKVDPYKLEARKLSFNDIESAIKYENISVSGGNMLENNIRRSVRIIGEFKSVDDIKNIIISNQNNKVVYLKDVAKVVFDYKEIEKITHICCGYPDKLDVINYPKAPLDSYKKIAKALDASLIDSVSIEDAHRYNDLELLRNFTKTKVIFGLIKIASSQIETKEEIENRVLDALNYIDKKQLIAAPDCGLGHLPRQLAIEKLKIIDRTFY